MILKRIYLFLMRKFFENSKNLRKLLFTFSFEHQSVKLFCKSGKNNVWCNVFSGIFLFRRFSTRYFYKSWTNMCIYVNKYYFSRLNLCFDIQFCLFFFLLNKNFQALLFLYAFLCTYLISNSKQKGFKRIYSWIITKSKNILKRRHPIKGSRVKNIITPFSVEMSQKIICKRKKKPYFQRRHDNTSI